MVSIVDHSGPVPEQVSLLLFYLQGAEKLMGMLVDGQWIEEDRIIVNGAFQRAEVTIHAVNHKSLVRKISADPERFLLIASRSCPWSHRVVLLCALKGLRISTHFAFGERQEGYALNGGLTWSLPGTERPLRHLHQVYARHDPMYTGRATVPVLWDCIEQRIVSNESAELLKLLDQVHTGSGPEFSFRPPHLCDQIDTANTQIYNGLNNAVYRAGFATMQDAYDDAVGDVFDTLNCLEQRMDTSRYYFGELICETDLRIFPTLIRFDAIYAILFKCSFRRLVDYPNLWAYARDLYCLKGVAGTADIDQMRRASYLADSHHPNPIVAIAPDVDWKTPHGRETLGDTKIWLRSGKTQVVTPSPFQPLKESS